MKITYIGQYSEGSTSRARGECLRQLLPNAEFTVIDTCIPQQQTASIWKSVGWRWKIGPYISNINNYIINHLPSFKQNVIWVDKAVTITPETTKQLKENANKIVHYTPDPAFLFHRSRLFFQSIKYYDVLITTKSFEIDEYKNAVKGSNTKIIFSTQGYSPTLHRPIVSFEQKKGVVFIGHNERERVNTINKLLSNGIYVTLAGIKWDKFVNDVKSPQLNYLGKGVFGEDYVKIISSGLFGWGALSKWIPEIHTTRTFEIPACGTALLTEWNEEIASFYNNDEAIFYRSDDEMIELILYYQEHLDELQKITENGLNAVRNKGYDYLSVMKKILVEIGILNEKRL